MMHVRFPRAAVVEQVRPLFAADIRRLRVSRMQEFRHWRWQLDEMYVKIGGKMQYLWRAIDHEVRSSRATSPPTGTKPPP
jgi:transposase-like protein